MPWGFASGPGEAARYSGIRTTRVIVAAYVICDGLAALSAIFFAMYTRSILPSGHGNFYELYAIAAAVLGEQFVQLREAHRRAMDHALVRNAVDEGHARLARLRNDLVGGILPDDQVRQALLSETTAAQVVENSVLQVMEHHRINQRTLERQPLVDSLLAPPQNDRTER